MKGFVLVSWALLPGGAGIRVVAPYIPMMFSCFEVPLNRRGHSITNQPKQCTITGEILQTIDLYCRYCNVSSPQMGKFKDPC